MEQNQNTKFNLNDWSQKIDWRKLQKFHPNVNDALKVLKEDYYQWIESFEENDTQSFKRWLKRDKINFDSAMSMIKLGIKDDTHGHGRPT